MPKNNKDADKLFTPREMAANLRNLTLIASRPKSGEIPAAKMGKLREFTEALVEPFRELIEEEAMTVDQLVFVLVAAAYYVHESAYKEL